MDKLPHHGRIDCTRCYPAGPVEFDKTRNTESGWRVTANPLAWGNTNAEVVVLGFSKGPTQAGALTTTPHNDIAYKGGRANVAKILSYIGLLSVPDGKDATMFVGEQIADSSGRFHFGSLIRCTVERYDEPTSTWKGSGGGMLDKFVATEFGQCVSRNCIQQHLSDLSDNTKLIVMFGLGTALNYVKSSFELYRNVLGGDWKWLNDVAYTDGNITVVHVEHFASQGALIPQWLGNGGHERGRLGRLAREAVSKVTTQCTDKSPMKKLFCIVKRGRSAGVKLTPHLHKDGAFVVSLTRFEKDYIRVFDEAELPSWIAKGYSLRMSNLDIKSHKSASLVTPSSIDSE